MKIDSLFTIVLSRILCDSTGIIGYEVALYNEDYDDFETIIFKNCESKKCIVQDFYLSPQTMEIIQNNYKSMNAFLSSVYSYLKSIV